RPEFRIALAINLARQGQLDDARKQFDLAPATPASRLLRAAIKRDTRELQELAASDPIAKGDLGLVLWSTGKADDAKPHLAAALAASPSWNEVALASGELAIGAREYSRAADILASVAKCEERAGAAAEITLGKSDNLCA